ncbi:hypothetical protein WT60_11035 [Burkholderia sp. MSMB617WGS]|nr:hypothetical protein WT60_11035 [Burkholderia sp. MSMB617WGS]
MQAFARERPGARGTLACDAARRDVRRPIHRVRHSGADLHRSAPIRRRSRTIRSACRAFRPPPRAPSALANAWPAARLV